MCTRSMYSMIILDVQCFQGGSGLIKETVAEVIGMIVFDSYMSICVCVLHVMYVPVGGALSPEVQAAQSQLRQLKYHQYKVSW